MSNVMHYTDVNRALLFAIEKHRHQSRKNYPFEPYVFHPIDVAREILYYSDLQGDDLRVACIIALLHDVLEDTNTTEEELEQEFDIFTARSVAALTKDPVLVSRDIGFVENLERIKQASPIVWCVKLADRISNLKDLPDIWSATKISSYLDESMLLVRDLSKASPQLAARLRKFIETNRYLLTQQEG